MAIGLANISWNGQHLGGDMLIFLFVCFPFLQTFTGGQGQNVSL